LIEKQEVVGRGGALWSEEKRFQNAPTMNTKLRTATPHRYTECCCANLLQP
jgi:hypothetical protein